ncbi:MAG: MmgE/PrpD family protein [Boseongicola sp. SB0662_bin_57]|nr:MmgE/PrpD family protein [Boseongicola sp. SB0662_bin_57]
MAEATAIETLARHLVSATRSDIPDDVYERAKDCVVDVMGAAAAGANSSPARATNAGLTELVGPGRSSVWFSDAQGGAAAAAAANAMAATALDVDDGHRKAAGHPGAAVVSAAIAAAEESNASVEEFLCAVVLGYEASVAAALARLPEHHGSTVSGRWSGVGAAVAAARLRGVTSDVMANAILVAEQHAPRLTSAQLHGFAGSDVKEGISWSVLTGIAAAGLAAHGFKGYPGTFEGMLYDAELLVGDLGKFQAIGGLFFKPYACCRWIHAAMDCLHDIVQSWQLKPEDISRIEVRTFKNAVRLANAVEPKSGLEAQFSIPFCLGAMAVRGPEALCPLDRDLLSDSRITDVARRTHIAEDPGIERLFPACTAAIVRVELPDASSFERRADTPLGDPTNPMDRVQLVRKFKRLIAEVAGSCDVPWFPEALFSAPPESRLSGLTSMIRCPQPASARLQ